ncbi:MAG TPA: hypothetical protein VKG23_17575 [Thermoanaerobaculia bacterium]|nr:hypothetical protein [Thermoanaerobaculia bacterium]
MRFLGSALLALAGSTLLGPSPLTAQNVRESVRVDVVTVRLSVRDSSGKPILDLKPSDLELAIDGRAQAIDALTLVGPPSDPATSGLSNTGPGAGSGDAVARTAIFLDEGETKVSDRAKVYGEIGRYLEGSDSGDQLMIARFDGAQMDVVTRWTTDRGAVSATLSQLATQASPLKILSTSDAERGIRSGSIMPGGSSAGALSSLSMNMELNTYRSRLETALLEVLAAFPMEPSTKRVILVSSGTALTRPADLAAAFQAPHVEQLSPEQATCSSKACLRKVEQSRTAFTLWERAANHAKGLSMDDVVVKALEHDVALVPIAADPFAGGRQVGVDARGNIPPDTVSLHGGAIKAFWEIAEQSGGEPILVPAKTGARLGEIGGRAVYELSFRDPFVDDHHLHSIGVVSRRKGVEIDYRRGYRILPEDERTLDAVVARLSRAADDNPSEPSFALALGPADTSGKNMTRLRLTFTAPAEKGLAENRDFVVIAVGERDDGSRTDPVRFKAVGERASSASTEYTAVSDLKIPYGRYTWSLAVQDAQTGLIAYAVVKPQSAK